MFISSSGPTSQHQTLIGAQSKTKWLISNIYSINYKSFVPSLMVHFIYILLVWIINCPIMIPISSLFRGSQESLLMETNIICFTKLHRNLLKQILACTLSNNQSQTRQKESRLKLKLKVRQFAWRDKLSNTLMGLFMTVLLQSQKQFQIPKNAFISNSTWRDKHQPQFTHKVSK